MDDSFDKPAGRFDAMIGRLSVLEAKTSAAHTRMDHMESLIRDDLQEMKKDFQSMSQELKDVIGWMNRGKGWAAAFLLIIGIMGGTLVTLIMKVAQ